MVTAFRLSDLARRDRVLFHYIVRASVLYD